MDEVTLGSHDISLFLLCISLEPYSPFTFSFLIIKLVKHSDQYHSITIMLLCGIVDALLNGAP